MRVIRVFGNLDFSLYLCQVFPLWILDQKVRRIEFKAVFLLPFLLVLSCSRQELAPDNAEDKNGKITVGFLAGGSATRTLMRPDGLSASWEEGDRLALWARTPAGSYALAAKEFVLYGLGDDISLFTTTLDAPMQETTYSYFLTYPVPESVNGTTASFTIPSTQDGRVSSGADILVGVPQEHGALTGVPEMEDHSGLRMHMKHILHQFRFFIPSDAGFTGGTVSDITMTMPRPVAGTITTDFTNPDAEPALLSGTNSITLNLEQPLTVSAESTDYACVSMCPSSEAYSEGDSLRLLIYSATQRYEADPISLAGRSFAAGHSTPVRLYPKNPQPFYRLVLRTGKDYIGETLTHVRIKEGDNVLFTYANESGQYDDLCIVQEYLGTDGGNAYNAICSAIEGGTAVLEYETANALVTRAISPASMSRNDNRAEVSLGDVPYLLYEDFSTSTALAHDDDYTASTNSDRNVQGYLLDGHVTDSGWNAARFGLFEGDCIRINCRYQSGAWVVERWCGRLDTPALSYLKPGASVTVVMEYDEAFYVPAGYNRDDSATAMACYRIGTHTNSTSSTLNGCKSDDIASNASIVFTSAKFASEDVTSMHHCTQEIGSAGPSTRIVFFADTGRTTSVVAANSCYYLYLDNVKVYIK